MPSSMDLRVRKVAAVNRSEPIASDVRRFQVGRGEGGTKSGPIL